MKHYGTLQSIYIATFCQFWSVLVNLFLVTGLYFIWQYPSCRFDICLPSVFLAANINKKCHFEVWRNNIVIPWSQMSPLRFLVLYFQSFSGHAGHTNWKVLGSRASYKCFPVSCVVSVLPLMHPVPFPYSENCLPAPYCPPSLPGNSYRSVYLSIKQCCFLNISFVYFLHHRLTQFKPFHVHRNWFSTYVLLCIRVPK